LKYVFGLTQAMFFLPSCTADRNREAFVAEGLLELLLSYA